LHIVLLENNHPDLVGMSSGPTVNPKIKEFFSSLGSAGHGIAQRVLDDDQVTVMGVFMRVLIIAAFIAIYVWYSRYSTIFENRPNILRISKEATQAQLDYAKNNPKRKSIRQYLQSLQAAKIPANQMCLTNFYVSTVNAAGIFFPSYNGVASAEAARAAVLAGARGFVLDIWPDLTGGANYAPIVQVVESGSAWRRISLNSLPLSSVLQAIIQEGFQMRERPGYDDPLFLYLRFRGSPRSSTFEATRNVLSATLEQFRLDASYNKCRAQDRLYTLPITNFFRKVIIFSNTRADGTTLADYINAAPRDGIKIEYNVEDARALTFSMQGDAIQKIKMNMTWLAPGAETPEAENNSYDVEGAQSLGIHFCAMNFWNRNDRLAKYMDPSVFGTQSFLIKPAKLRYIMEVIADPKQPFNPQWGTGATAGTMKDPPPIKMP
jgi:hypothetical protein